MNPKARRDKCREFVEYLHDHPKGIFQVDDPDTWLRNAINTSGGSGNEEGEIIAIGQPAHRYLRAYILAAISRLAMEETVSQNYFDSVFFDLTGDLERAVHQHCPQTTFRFGRAQKIATIYLKLLYAGFWGEYRDTGENGEPLAWLGRWSGCLHIPIDRKTLDYFDNKLRPDSFTKVGGKILSWKKHLGRNQYGGIQEQARRIAAERNYLDPPHLEMAEIWTQPAGTGGSNTSGSPPAGPRQKCSGCGTSFDSDQSIDDSGASGTPTQVADSESNTNQGAGRVVVFLEENARDGEIRWLKLVEQCGATRSDGLIEWNNHCLNLKSQDSQAPRYLIGEIRNAGGDFCSMPGYAVSVNGATYGWSGTGYQGYVPFETVDDAIRYLKQYFTVRACGGNEGMTQKRIDGC